MKQSTSRFSSTRTLKTEGPHFPEYPFSSHPFDEECLPTLVYSSSETRMAFETTEPVSDSMSERDLQRVARLEMTIALDNYLKKKRAV